MLGKGRRPSSMCPRSKASATLPAGCPCASQQEHRSKTRPPRDRDREVAINGPTRYMPAKPSETVEGRSAHTRRGRRKQSTNQHTFQVPLLAAVSAIVRCREIRLHRSQCFACQTLFDRRARPSHMGIPQVSRGKQTMTCGLVRDPAASIKRAERASPVEMPMIQVRREDQLPTPMQLHGRGRADRNHESPRRASACECGREFEGGLRAERRQSARKAAHPPHVSVDPSYAWASGTGRWTAGELQKTQSLQMMGRRTGRWVPEPGKAWPTCCATLRTLEPHSPAPERRVPRWDHAIAASWWRWAGHAAARAGQMHIASSGAARRLLQRRAQLFACTRDPPT